MKKDIHPQTHPVIFRDAGAGVDFRAWSTVTSEEKETVDGTEYFVIRLDVSSASHPFFTGKQKLVDTSGRVERFKKQMEKASSKE
ncbi:MAG: type B 50S ribosomal protein L31 [Candidatus Gracilibacteria bacterium]|nr:type B 50S ribosomal protein L31 [Candidatus Gracilibacteria bacterium]